jgi:hypothetical protein
MSTSPVTLVADIASKLSSRLGLTPPAVRKHCRAALDVRHLFHRAGLRRREAASKDASAGADAAILRDAALCVAPQDEMSVGAPFFSAELKGVVSP